MLGFAGSSQRLRLTSSPPLGQAHSRGAESTEYHRFVFFLTLRAIWPMKIDTDNTREGYSDDWTKMVVANTLPEVQQYTELRRQAYQDLPLTQMKG